MIGTRVSILAFGILIGCAGPISSFRETATPDDFVVTAADWINGVRLGVGDTIRVPVPGREHRWTVVTSRNVLRVLTPADRVEQPGADGWRFEAIAPGTGSITFTGVTPADPGQPDPPNPPKFILEVTVR